MKTTAAFDSYSEEEADELPDLRMSDRDSSRRTSAQQGPNITVDKAEDDGDGAESPGRRASGSGLRDKMANEIQEMQHMLDTRRMSQMNRRQSLVELIPGFPQLRATEKKKVEKDEFKEELVDTKVTEGSPIGKFRCVFSKPSTRYRWMKNKLEIFQGHKYNFINNGCEYILEIKKVKMEDAGLYTCKINDEVSTTAALDVVEQQKKYNFNQKLPETVHVVRGKDLNLECSVNDPRAHVNWYRSGEKLEMKRRENRCILRIVKARDEDETEFACLVEGDETYTDIIVDDPNWFFNRNLRPQECFEGDKEVVFECEVNEKDAVVKWFFCSNPDVNPMDVSKLQKLEEKDETQYKMESLQRTKRKLTVFNLDMDWHGVIICRTAKKTTVAKLTVKPDVEFKKSLYDTKGIELRKKELMVSLRNPKQHEVYWFKNGEPIQPNERIEVKQNKDDYYLIFNSLELDDEAEYSVKVGKHGCKCNMQVEECEKPPCLAGKLAQMMRVKKGQPFSCSIPVKGFPIPNVALIRNGEPVPETVQLKAIPGPGQVQLVLDDARGATRADRGKYQLKLFNSAGEEYVPFEFEVLDRPDKPGEPLDVMELAHDGCTLMWDPPEDDGGSPITAYDVELMDVADGQWKPFKSVKKEECRVTGLVEGNKYKFRVRAVNAEGHSDWLETTKATLARDPWDPPDPPGPCKLLDWDKNFAELDWTAPKNDNGSPVLKYVIESRSKTSTTWTVAKEVGPKDLKAKVEGLKEGQEYEFRVIAVNKAGSSDPSAPAGPVVAKPRFLKPRIDRMGIKPVNIKAGAPIVLELKFIGEPPPTPVWVVGDNPLAEDIQVESDIGCSKVTIKEGLRKHTGLYRLTVTNEVGEDSAEIEVVVLGKPSRPEGPLQVSEVTKNSCQLSWKPPKDDGGSPIQNYVLQKYDLKKREWETVSEMVAGTTFTANKLQEGHEYLFRVSAETAQGVGEPLETEEPTKIKNPFEEPDAPSPPEILDHNKTFVKIAYKPPRSDGGAPILGYIIERKEIKGTRWTKVTRDRVVELEFTDETVKENKEYEYRVTAVNKAGPSQPSGPSKHVKAKPAKAAPKLNLDSLGLGPGREIRVRAGEPIEIQIPIEGAPKPTITWTRDSRAQMQAAARVTDTEELTGFRVDSAKKADAGTYHVSLTNEHGKEDASIRVVVMDKPDPPEGPLEVKDLLADSCRLQWKPPKDTGGCEILDYIVEMCEEGSGIWEKVPGATDQPTCAVKQLVEGKRYRFRVKAVNRFGVSEPLETSGGAILAKNPFDAPDAPEHLTIEKYDRFQVSLAWKPPKSDGGNPIVGYVIEKKQKGSDWEKATPFVPSTEKLSFNVTSLNEGREYEFRVCAVNAAGLGKPSKATQPLIVRDPVFPAGPPGDLNVDKQKKDGVQLSWAKPKNEGGGKVKDYVVEKKNPDGEWVPVKTVPANERSAFVPMAEGEEAQFRVRAENEAGPGEPTRPTKTLKAENQPEAPRLDLSGLRDLTIKAGQDLVIKIPYTGFPKPTAEFEKDDKDFDATSEGKLSITETPDGDAGQLVYTVAKATGSNSGEYKITLRNSMGKDTGSLRVTVLDKPGPCTGPLEATDIDANQVTLKWAPPKSDGGEPVSNYVLEKRIKGTDEWLPVSSFLSSPTATVKNLEEGKPYEFRVMAENAQGRGEPLQTISPVTPKLPFEPPSACNQPAVEEVTADSVALSWQPPRNNGGSPVTGYIVEKRAK
uniref:Ig-like domain-containing protein n=1 Tax=Macrostomum lignano TaxID=282301 RepID=A0A1I8G362_9PLAT